MATGRGFLRPSSHLADLTMLEMRSVIADNKARTYQGGGDFFRLASPNRPQPV